MVHWAWLIIAMSAGACIAVIALAFMAWRGDSTKGIYEDQTDF